MQKGDVLRPRREVDCSALESRPCSILLRERVCREMPRVRDLRGLHTSSLQSWSCVLRTEKWRLLLEQSNNLFHVLYDVLCR